MQLCDFRYVRRFLTHDTSVPVANASTHFSGISLSLVYLNYSVSKMVQPELYQIPVDTPVQLLCLRKCIGYLLNIARFYIALCSLNTLLSKFLHTGFLKYIAPYLSSYSSCYSIRRIQSDGN